MKSKVLFISILELKGGKNKTTIWRNRGNQKINVLILNKYYSTAFNFVDVKVDGYIRIS